MSEKEKIIHQVFLKVTDKTIEDYPIFVEGVKQWKEWCRVNGYRYKLWEKMPYEYLNEKDKHVLNEVTKRFYFAPVDFIRMPILEHYGGMYVDLDVFPTNELIKIIDNETIFGTGLCPNGQIHINNNVMKCSKENARKMRLFCHQQFDEKMLIEVYKTWKIRFFLRTVGVSMVSKFVKKELNYQMIPLDDFKLYFTDHVTRSWSQHDK